MPYDPIFLTLDELYNRKGGQDAVELLGGGPDSVERGLEDAESEARSYLAPALGPRLPTTTATTPAVLKRHVTSAAIYHARSTKVAAISDDVQLAYDAAVSWYRAVAAGKADLPFDDPPATSTTRSSGIRVSSPRALSMVDALAGTLP